MFRVAFDHNNNYNGGGPEMVFMATFDVDNHHTRAMLKQACLNPEDRIGW